MRKKERIQFCILSCIIIGGVFICNIACPASTVDVKAYVGYPFFPWDQKPGEIIHFLGNYYTNFNYYELKSLMAEFDNHHNNDSSHGNTGKIYWRKIEFEYDNARIELIIAFDERATYIQSLPPIHRIGVREHNYDMTYEETYQYDIRTGGWLHWIKCYAPSGDTDSSINVQPRRIWPKLLWVIRDKYWLVPDLLVPKGDLSSANEFALSIFLNTLEAVRQTKSEKVLDLEEVIHRIAARIALMRYEEDVGEHLQSKTETEERASGDCEDFTLYFLVMAKKYGVPLRDLGINLIRTHIEDSIYSLHSVPLIYDGKNWLYLDTLLESGTELKPEIPYSKAAINNGSEINDVEVYNFNGLDKSGTITVLTKEAEFTLPVTLDEWLAEKLERAKLCNYIPAISEKEIRAEFEEKLQAYPPEERKRVLKSLSKRLRNPENKAGIRSAQSR